MVILGVITLILLIWSLIYYSYLANHSEHDVSFFMSVTLILLVMNLATNAAGTFGLAWVYLIVSVIFLGVGFAIDKHTSVAFYQSIGPWFKKTFTDSAFVYHIFCFLFCPVALICYFTLQKTNVTLARSCGRSGLFGLLFGIVLVWAVFGLVL